MNTQIPPKETDSLACWLNYLEHAHSKPIDMGLERVRSVAEQLDLLQPAPYIWYKWQRFDLSFIRSRTDESGLTRWRLFLSTFNSL